jgi:hypothetical protein
LTIVFGGCFYVSPDEHAQRWDVDQDGVERPQDCDDKDPDVQKRVWYADTDGDGYGDSTSSVRACEAPAGMVENAEDCDDGADTVHPAALEVCNEVDDDCNDLVDDGEGVVLTWYVDGDGDGFGDEGGEVCACEAPPGTVPKAGDCDDTSPEVHPDASDVCNGIDDDCSGVPDDDTDFWIDWFVDGDGDGYGDEESDSVSTGCTGLEGEAPNAEDCDDLDSQVNPFAEERCDGGDNDCDGVTDPPTSVDATQWWLDSDGDGFGLVTDVVTLCTCEAALGCQRVENAQDCDDDDPGANPQADEICDNGQDDNCNFQTDEPLCVSCDSGDTGC